MNEQEIIDKLFTRTQRTPVHPAWKLFVEEMDGRQYGYDALSNAWEWFKSGWDAADRIAK